jgi:uncharacterized RDD family membrane protein YckC
MTKNEVAYAGFSRRLLAHNIDLLPILILLYGSSLIFSNTGFDWVIYSIIYLGYHTLFELSSWSATPGKRWTKIHVSSDDLKTTPVKIIIRNLSKILSLLLLFSGFIMIIFHPKQKGLHDYLAGTLVLFDE